MIELPRWDAGPEGVPQENAEKCLAQVDAWAESLRDHPVVATFSESESHIMDGLCGAKLLDALEIFATGHWDFRRGRERNLSDRPAFSALQVVAVDSAATELGLSGTLPPRRRDYDAVVMTGGMVRAGIVKPRYLRELYDSGLTWREGTFLGAFRPFAGDELDVGPALGVEGTNEFDAMSAGTRLAFGLAEPDFTRDSRDSVAEPSAEEGSNFDNESWREDTWEWNDRTLRVIAAPSSDPHRRRANTVDTYRFWASRAHGIRSVLVVTTPVYVPYQGAGAIEVLGVEFGFSVETVAVSAAASDLGEHTQVFLPMHRAQELRSAVHGMRSLRQRLTSLR